MGDIKHEDDYADDPARYSEDVENLLHRADGPQIITEKQQREAELQFLRERDFKRDVVQGEMPDEDLNESFQYYADDVWENYKASEEGDQVLRRDFDEKYGTVPPGPDSHDVYAEGHQGYLRRKAERDKDR